MIKKLTIVLLLIFVATPILRAQDKPSYGIKFKGYVKLDAFFDSRQTVAAREGHLVLYPMPEVLGDDGEDLNAVPNTNLLAIQTRLTGVISAPDAFGAKVSGVIEGAFFGHSNADVNGFRLRHAFAKLAWDKTTLLFGQYWHPMFVTQVFPGVVNFNTGMPINPFSRNPQIRLTQKLGDNANLILAALAQRDFTSTGPNGANSKYLRDAVIPNLHAQLQAKVGKHVMGAGVDYKILHPNLVTPYNKKSTSTVSGLSGIGYLRLNLPNAVTAKFYGGYFQNTTDHIMLGGYVQNGVGSDGDYEYSPMSLVSAWTELIVGKVRQFGIFAGYVENQGAGDVLKQDAVFYARSANIKSVLKIVPRVVFNSGKARFSLEVEWSQAGYADLTKANAIDDKGKVLETNSVSNLRVLFATYLFF